MQELIDLLEMRNNQHLGMIKILKTYGNMFHDDIKQLEGQIMENVVIMEWAMDREEKQ